MAPKVSKTPAPKRNAKPRTSGTTAPRPPSPDEVDHLDHEAKKAGLSRRAFNRILAFSTGAVAFAASAAYLYEFTKKEFDFETDEDLLRQLFGIGAASSAALMPAGNHPWKEPPAGMPWYPFETASATAYRERFFRDASIRTVSGNPQVRPKDSIILFGSQVSNLNTRELMGNPWRDDPILSVQGEGWQADLRWNLHTPPSSPMTERVQFGEVWRTENHMFADRHGQPISPKAGIGWMEDDFLLVTVLPRYGSENQRIVVFSGIHAPGSQAAELLFRTPSSSDLRKLLKKVRREPFYQALFRVAVSRDASSQFVPTKLELVEGHCLEVRFA